MKQGANLVVARGFAFVVWTTGAEHQRNGRVLTQKTQILQRLPEIVWGDVILHLSAPVETARLSLVIPPNFKCFCVGDSVGDFAVQTCKNRSKSAYQNFLSS